MRYKAVGGLYQPLNGRGDARPRGLMLAGEDPSLWLYDNDRVDEEAARELLARCEADALKAIAELRDGLSMGQRPGYLEACLVPQVYNARRFDCPLDAYPRILARVARCEALDAFSRAVPEVQPDAT